MQDNMFSYFTHYGLTYKQKVFIENVKAKTMTH